MTKKQKQEDEEQVRRELAVALVDHVQAKLEHRDALEELIRALKGKAKPGSKSQT